MQLNKKTEETENCKFNCPPYFYSILILNIGVGRCAFTSFRVGISGLIFQVLKGGWNKKYPDFPGGNT
jgi:hypothetical protein